MASQWSLSLHHQGPQRWQDRSEPDCWNSLNSYFLGMSHQSGILSQMIFLLKKQNGIHFSLDGLVIDLQEIPYGFQML